ncbi:hypothetical protein ES706_05173 [subsurface metagenome]
MPDGLLTPGLVLEVAEAAKDYVITPQEFNDIMGTVTGIFLGIATAGLVGMLIGSITEGFIKETGIKVKTVAGVPIPIY